MNCQQNDSQIQSWLDGDTDESLHLSECPECQQRLLSMQKLRSRMTPPPSPLGRDFARRTAQHVLRVTDVVKPQKPSGGWLAKLRDNPLVHVVQRERSRRLLRLPGLAAVLLLYLLPGSLVHQFGEADANWAYFGMVRIGLTLLLPLFLLGLEWSTLSTLVRGRCLEEMLQAGLEPVLVSDTLALCGLRSLLPALLMIGVALLPLHPESLLVWLPMTTIAFSAAGYLSQAYFVGLKWPRWLSFLGAAAIAGSLAAPPLWNLLSSLVVLLLGMLARRHSIESLELQQQGRLPSNRRPVRGGPWQLWLARRLPDLALLQRELRRRNLLTPSILVGNLGVCVAAYTAFGYGAFCWPLLSGTAGLLAAFSLVQREKDGGAYEVLHHSGVRPQDFWASAVWIAGFQFLPACLLAVAVTLFRLWSVSPFSACTAALGTGLSLFISLRAGAVIGASIAVESQNSRQASTRCIQEVALLCCCSLLLVGLVAPLFGDGSPLFQLLRILRVSLSDALDGVAVLPVMLALHLRARLLSGHGAGFNPWTYSLALLTPLAIWFQVASSFFYRNNNTEANSCTGLALLLGLVWAWWAAPLVQRPGARRWLLVSLSYLAVLLVGLPVTAWSFYLLTRMNYEFLPVGISEINWPQTSLIVTFIAWLVYLLGKRLNWQAPSIQRSGWRTLWAGGLAAITVSWFLFGLVSIWCEPRHHKSEIPAFLAAHSRPPEPTSQMQRLLRLANINGGSYRHTQMSQTHPYELRNLKGREQWFQSLLIPLLKDLRAGSLRDRKDAFSLLSLQADEALYTHQSALYLELLEQMTLLSQQAEQLHSGSAVDQSWSLRTQLLVALRTQSWTSSQLQQLDRLQASFPDGPAALEANGHSQAVSNYRNSFTLNRELYLPLNQDPIARFLLQQQAELFLDYHLANPNEFYASGPITKFFFYSRSWRDHSALERDLIRAANRLTLDLEEYRQTHGSYPESWKGHPKGIRILYQRLGQSYFLKMWMPRVDQYPLVLSTRGEEWRLNRGYDYY